MLQRLIINLLDNAGAARGTADFVCATDCRSEPGHVA